MIKQNSTAIFSGNAQVEIQGPRALEFVSLDETQAEFQIIGITQPSIRVIDQRVAVRRKMKEILETKEVEKLAEYFNRPARVTILPAKDGQIVVQLENTRAQNPRHMLWVAIGIGGDIPLYNYKKIEMQQIDVNSFALFSLYKRPRHNTI